jgi:hypothetical protein
MIEVKQPQHRRATHGKSGFVEKSAVSVEKISRSVDIVGKTFHTANPALR